MDVLTFQVVAVVFLAAVVRGLSGFGNALVAMPLLALILPMTVVTPLVGLSALVMGAAMLAGDWKRVHLRSAQRLLLGALPGIPLGLWFLKGVGARWVQLVLALLILAFCLQKLFFPHLGRLKTERWAWFSGFVAGVLGGAYNTNGPPIVIYGTMRGWEPKRFKATLQGFFVPIGIPIVFGHAVAGLWKLQVFQLLLFSLPVMFFGVWLGHWLSKRLPHERFNLLVYGILIFSALSLLLKSLRTA